MFEIGDIEITKFTLGLGGIGIEAVQASGVTSLLIGFGIASGILAVGGAIAYVIILRK